MLLLYLSVYTYVSPNTIPQTLHFSHNRLKRRLVSPLMVHSDESAAKHNQRANLSVEECGSRSCPHGSRGEEMMVTPIFAATLICIVRMRRGRRDLEPNNRENSDRG